MVKPTSLIKSDSSNLWQSERLREVNMLQLVTSFLILAAVSSTGFVCPLRLTCTKFSHSLRLFIKPLEIAVPHETFILETEWICKFVSKACIQEQK